jgi:flagellar biosynthesis component FlhA
MKVFGAKLHAKLGRSRVRLAALGFLATSSCFAGVLLSGFHFISLDSRIERILLAVAVVGYVLASSIALRAISRKIRSVHASAPVFLHAAQEVAPAVAQSPVVPEESVAKSPSSEDIHSLIGVDYMTVGLSVELAQHFIRTHSIEALRDSIQEVRKEIARETGVVVSRIHIREDSTLKPYSVEISIRDEVVSSLMLKHSRLLAIGSEEVLAELEGEETAGLVYHFTSKWIPPESVDKARSLGALVFPHVSIILSLVGQCSRDFLWKAFGRQELYTLMAHLRKQHPAVVDTFEQLHIPYDILHKVWRNLLQEGIWPRDPITILETILQEFESHRASLLWLNNSSSWARTIGEYQEVIDDLFNSTRLTEAVRKVLVPNQLRRAYGNRDQESNAVKYIVFSSALTKKLFQLGDRDHWSLLEVSLCEQLVRDLNQEYAESHAEFIKCDPSHRVAISQMLSAMHCKMNVYASDELPRDIHSEHYATYSESGLEISAELPNFPSDVIYKQFQTNS